MSDAVAYSGLFAVAFAAATLFPLQSEALLVAMLQGGYSPAVLILVACAGNVLGSIVNWFLGRGIESLKHRKWFPVNAQGLERAQRWYHRFGKWSLLLSWMPIIGDPLTIVAGVMREPLTIFLLLVTVAKLGRYVALTAITLSIV